MDGTEIIIEAYRKIGLRAIVVASVTGKIQIIIKGTIRNENVDNLVWWYAIGRPT